MTLHLEGKSKRKEYELSIKSFDSFYHNKLSFINIIFIYRILLNYFHNLLYYII